ncbi:MAG TPA: hypothetical protein VGF99_06465 [Myxococcota bacterium]
MAEFQLDLSGLPVVVVGYPDRVSVDEYRALFTRYRDLCREHSRIAWLIDFRRYNPVLVTPDVRRAAADCFAEFKEDLLRSTVCEARVVDSVAARGVLIGFDWLTGTKWPTKNFGRRESAERWCADMLAR